MKQEKTRTDRHSQGGFINTVKDWLTPEAIKEVKRNQAVTKKQGDKALKK